MVYIHNGNCQLRVLLPSQLSRGVFNEHKYSKMETRSDRANTQQVTHDICVHIQLYLGDVDVVNKETPLYERHFRGAISALFCLVNIVARNPDYGHRVGEQNG